jgi:hypothetical protein
LAQEIIDRAQAEGSPVEIDAETLAMHGGEEILAKLLGHPGRISDLDSLMREYGIDLPTHPL